MSTVDSNLDPLLPLRHPIHHQDSINEKAIHDAARITSWTEVLELCHTYPQYASYKCEDGLTALHHACSRRCPNPLVIQALIHAYPQAIQQMDDTNKGWTPLHHACRFKLNRESIQMLLYMYPDAGKLAARMRDKERGRTALYYALRYDAPEGVVELLLEAMEGKDILDVDRDGISVLSLVWDRWAMSYEGKRYLSHYFKIQSQWKDMMVGVTPSSEWWSHVQKDASALRSSLRGKMKENWNQVDLILRGAFRFPLIQISHEQGQQEQLQQQLAQDNHLTKKRTWRILHAISAIRCHETLSTVACILYPEQAREFDDHDLIAMGAICSKSQHLQNKSSTSLDPPQLTALHIASQGPTFGNESKSLLESLLLLYPQAASIVCPADGSLPLHYLCANEWKLDWVRDGIQSVYEAYPQAVFVQDIHGRTPLHRIALTNDSFHHKKDSDDADAVAITVPLPPFSSFSMSLVAQHHAFNLFITGHPIHDPTTHGISSVDDPSGSIALNILSRHPEVASIPDNDGKMPLHLISEFAEDWDANLQAIYDAYPQAIQEPKECLPLHLAARNADAKPRLIQKLVEYHPEAASTKNDNGCLAFHIACESGKLWNGGLDAIYNAYPEAINVKEENNRQWTALHCVISNPSTSLSTVEKILSLNPDAAHAVDFKGRTAFQLSLECGRHWDGGGLEILFQANPDAIDSCDIYGNIPLITALLKYGRDRSGRDKTNGCDTFCGRKNELVISQMNTIYNLIRSAPHVIQSCTRNRHY